MAAGRAVLSKLSKDFYKKLNERSENFLGEARHILKRKKTKVCIQNAGSMFTLFFGRGPIENFQDAKRADEDLFKKYFHGLLRQGIYTPPSRFEASFLSTAHSKRILKKTLKALDKI